MLQVLGRALASLASKLAGWLAGNSQEASVVAFWQGNSQEAQELATGWQELAGKARQQVASLADYYWYQEADAWNRVFISLAYSCKMAELAMQQPGKPATSVAWQEAELARQEARQAEQEATDAWLARQEAELAGNNTPADLATTWQQEASESGNAPAFWLQLATSLPADSWQAEYCRLHFLASKAGQVKTGIRKQQQQQLASNYRQEAASLLLLASVYN